MNLTTISSGQTVFLQNNINCDGITIIPLNVDNVIFNGQGFRIRRLSIDTTSKNTGLFGNCNNLTICDVCFRNFVVQSTKDNVGVVVGNCSGCTLRNINFTISSNRNYVNGS